MMEENLIPVEHKPIKKIVVVEIVPIDANELFKRTSAIRMSGQRAFVLSWAEGILFLALPASLEIKEVNDNIMKGIVYFSSILYSSMPKYEPIKKVGGDQIPIVDQSKSTLYRSLAVWLKKRLHK